MGVITQKNLYLEIPISDKVLNGTILKRKADIVSLEYNMRTKQVTICVAVIPYSFITNADGTISYGEKLSDIPGFTEVIVLLVAAYDTVINIETGEVSPSSILNDDNEWKEGGSLFGKKLMYEYEYFKMIATSQPVIVDQLLSQFVLKADKENRF